MIKSAQNITPAPLFDRLFALFADTLIQGVIVLIVTFCIALIPTEIIKTREYILNITYIVFVVLIGPIYNTIFLFKLGNTTPGKKLFDLYLLNFQDKSELGWGQIIFREVKKSLLQLFIHYCHFCGHVADYAKSRKALNHRLYFKHTSC
jgi:uncharacterized RDD family membrane protein YckC